MYLLKQGTFENQKMFQYAAIMCVQFTCIKVYSTCRYTQSTYKKQNWPTYYFLIGQAC